MKAFKNIADKSSTVLLWLSVIALLSSMLLVVYNAIIRNFTDPIAGTPEIAGLLGLFAITFALGYTQQERGNVGINILTEKMSPLYRNICEFVTTLLSLAFFTLVTYKLVEYGQELMLHGSFLQTTGLPIYPFVFLMSVGFLGLVIQLVYQVVEAALKIKVGESA